MNGSTFQTDDLVYEWVRFFKGQVYEWGRFRNTIYWLEHPFHNYPITPSPPLPLPPPNVHTTEHENAMIV